MSLSFDPENRLTAYGTAMTAGYRGDGLRAWKQNAAGKTYYLYDGTLPVVELDAAGAVAATNTFGGAALVSRRFGTQSTFYTFDPQGSVVQRTDASGGVVTSHLFDAHGGELSASSADPFGYGARWGYYTDRETGLQLLTHRYYDPRGGRFVTRDPIGYSGGVNLYGYVKNNPVNAVDPTGLIGVYAYPGERPRNPFARLSVEFPPHPEDGSKSARDVGISAELKYFPKDNQDNWDAYGGAYRHCVSSCILARRYSIWLAYPMVKWWDFRYEQIDDGTSTGDKIGEQVGLICAGGGDQPCAIRCLSAYPTPVRPLPDDQPCAAGCFW